MKIVFIILAFACLAQGTTNGHAIVVRQASNPVQTTIENAMTTIRSLDKIMKKAIVNGNTLIEKYTDNSTNYAKEYRISSSVQIKDMVLKALNETSPSMSSSDVNITACLDSQRNYTKDIGRTTTEDIGRCVATKVRQFRDIGMKLVLLANDTANFVPNTNANIQKCDSEPNDFFKMGCIGRTTGEASAKAAELLINLSNSMGTATGLYSTYQVDVNLCTQARILSFRRKLAVIPLTIGICTARRIMS